MAESAASLVGNLLGQIKAETARLKARMQDAPEELKRIAQEAIDQQEPLIHSQLINPIAREDWTYTSPEDRLLISGKRSEWVGWAQNQIEILRNLNSAMEYDRRDYAIMANNIFHQICSLGGEWHDIRLLAEQVKAFPNSGDVAYIAEIVLVAMRYIERDPHTNNVRLTPLGRQNCARGINIPPSDNQVPLR